VPPIMTDPDYSKRTAPTAPQPPSQTISPSQPIPFSENHTLTIGIQGGQGSFNEEAVQYFLQQNNISNSQIQYLYTSGKVMAAVQRGEIERGQCAIYNSVGGYVE